MKKLTHPFSVKTRIIAKNGSIYNKKWVYFRGSLPIERRISSPIFLKKQNSKKRYNNFLSFLKGKPVKKIDNTPLRGNRLYVKGSGDILNLLIRKRLVESKKFPHSTN